MAVIRSLQWAGPHERGSTRAQEGVANELLLEYRPHMFRQILQLGLCTAALTHLVSCKPTSTSPPEVAVTPAVPSISSSAAYPSPAPHPIDRSKCGLPAELLAENWPRTLEPNQSSDPSPPAQDAITIAVLPDTQYYTSCRERHFAEQTRYLARLSTERHLAATIFLGDLTEHNDPEEWQYLRAGLSLLPQTVPTVLVTGNHDYGLGGTADVRSTLFNTFVGTPSPKTSSTIVAQLEPGHLENVFYRIDAGPFPIAVLALEWSPRDATVAWARQVLERYPDERLIFVTNAYLYHDDTRYDWTRHGVDQRWNPVAYSTAKKDPKEPAGSGNLHPDGAWDGEQLWQGLLKDYEGLFLTLNGHVLVDGAGLLSSRGEHGNLVHQMLVNYQMLDEGGLGYLRLLEITSDGRTLTTKTYSPSLHLYATARDQLFDLPLEPPLTVK